MSLFNRNDKSGDIQPQLQATPPKAAQPQAALPQAVQPQTVPQPAESAAAKPAGQPTATAKPTPTPMETGAIMASVISKALKITGELESTEDIQIDGQIEGDVHGVGVKIGQNAKVKGTVYGDEVELAGTIEGKIESKKVILAGTARMTGDIWHQDIKIESGAYINGSLKPELGKSDAKPAAKQATATATAVSPMSKDNATAAAHH
jgi:cytoskeletal protein CcmA (bactofilin family)